MKYRFAAAPLAAFALLSIPASAQDDPARTKPMAPALPPAVPSARDVAYPGTVSLRIDARDVDRGVYRVTQTFPVAAGTRRLTLLQPGWLPGNHAPTGPFALLADIHFFADGREIPWVRDTVAVNAFHLDLPEGTKEVAARFVHTSPQQSLEGRITMTREMLNLQWEKMSLYPAGYYTRGVTVKPAVVFPSGWTVFTALDGMARSADTVTWDTTDYERLVDSPIFAGVNAKRWDLGRDVFLDVVADEPELLAITPEHLQAYRNLVSEALMTFGARHFDHYDFLLALTNRMGGIGLEHHRSSENQMEPKTWTDWDAMTWDRNVVPHEFVHSWNGKYRRPADLWTPDYQQPMQNTLLWVYEGQTQFWGYVLAARSGVQDKPVILGALAGAAAKYAEGTPGRGWRSVEDTTAAPILNERRPLPYASLTRGEDYYVEGALTWLEADQIIRQGTGGAKGLDDFAKAFFGLRDGDWGELTYDFDEVVKTLNAVHPFDWANFLRTRLYLTRQPAPLKGLEMGGYKLVWKDQPNPYDKGVSDFRKSLDLTYSLGISLDDDGAITAVLWDGPAYNAGLANGTKIVAVNGRAYDKDVIKDAITRAKPGNASAGAPIALLVRRGNRYQTVEIDYHGGLRWPWLESTTPGQANGLDRLLSPRRN
ncbi:glycyl aminopeptidase. Metallo peptidase. MEROPS family M61 [Novosphingobium sp. CF614]|uniref:M61 family metallopeptidase n=1 Tax=Novosphingobium sp. CF614 TaxID=1884364 RepID=UPI0008E79E57|nr:M61 family metallopeptidase [Novosphingobium sp. CF614]SFF78584.1 glycyl aminopeptidase. Metallo peptidase. MEROPS family M61 [Novosphingobium sp. CF614]